MKLLPVIILTSFLIMITHTNTVATAEVTTLKGPMEPDKDYSPYTFIYQLTGFFGAIFVIGPLLVPQGPNREVIRVGIMLTAFYMWISWVTIYCSQIHPMTSLTFSNETLAFLAYSWGSVGSIPVVKLPKRSTTPEPPRTRPTTTTKSTTKKKAKKKPTTTSKPIIILTPRTRYSPKPKSSEGKMRHANQNAAEKSLRIRFPMEEVEESTRKPMDTSTGTPTSTSPRTRTSTNTHTQSSTSTRTQSSTSTRTQTDLVIINKYYSYYQAEEPISLKVLAGQQPYRQFFVMLSAQDSWSEPRILIFIGADNGSKCTISKNGRIMVRTRCHLNWRNDTYLPFWIWFKNGEIVVKAGYGHPDYLKPCISWIDPKPFDVKYYGLRTKVEEQMSVILNDRYFEAAGTYDEYERDEDIMEFD